jgi:hypothetical protein
VNLNRKTYLAGMVLGGLLIFSWCIGLRFAADHAWAFLNVTLASNPAVTSSTNNIVLCTTIAGVVGLVLLALSTVSYIRSAHSRR